MRYFDEQFYHGLYDSNGTEVEYSEISNKTSVSYFLT